MHIRIYKNKRTYDFWPDKYDFTISEYEPFFVNERPDEYINIRFTDNSTENYTYLKLPRNVAKSLAFKILETLIPIEQPKAEGISKEQFKLNV